MNVENESKVDVQDDDEGSDHEKSLHCAAWQNRALILVGFALVFLLRVVRVTIVVLFLSCLAVRVHVSVPLLREPAELLCEDHVVNKNVLVGDHVDNSDQGHGNAEGEQVELSVPHAVVCEHHEEGDQASNLEDGTNCVRVGKFLEKAEAETSANDKGTSLGVKAATAAVTSGVMLSKPLDSVVL